MIGCGKLVKMEAQAHLSVDAPSFFKGRETAMPSGILCTPMAMAMISPKWKLPVAKPTPMAMPSGMEWMNIAIKIRMPFGRNPLGEIVVFQMMVLNEMRGPPEKSRAQQESQDDLIRGQREFGSKGNAFLGQGKYRG